MIMIIYLKTEDSVKNIKKKNISITAQKHNFLIRLVMILKNKQKLYEYMK